jgi:hypothetical protein
MSRAVADVVAERMRQIQEKGWTPEHDDEHDPGELSAAGAAYALAAADALHPASQGDGDFASVPPTCWCWDLGWWKPGPPRRMLEKAAALILAEIEKFDRAGDEAPTELKPSHSTVQQLLARAALDSDPISVFNDGTCDADTEVAIFVVKGKAHIDYLKGLAQQQRLLTPGKPVVDQ